MCKTHSVQAPHRATQNERTLHTCRRNRLLQEVWSHEGNREKHGVTNQRNDVHRLQLGQTGKSQNRSLGVFGGGFSVSVIAGKTMQRAWLLSLCKADRRNSQIVHRKKVIDCGIENFVSVEGTIQKMVPSKKISPAMGN